MNNYRDALPSDVPGYRTEPVGGMWLTDAARSDATMSAEHRAGLHSEPCGDCATCSSEAARLEGERDPFTAHVERRLAGPVDPWLVGGEFRDLPLGGGFQGEGGSQFDVALGHGDSVPVADPSRPVKTLDRD